MPIRGQTGAHHDALADEGDAVDELVRVRVRVRVRMRLRVRTKASG